MVVVDSSVAFKWLKSKDEPYYRESLVLLQNHLSGKEKIIAPSLIFLEVANALVAKTYTSQETIRKDIELLYKSNMEIYNPDKQDVLQASMLAKRHQTTVYDMLYAVIAKKHKVDLVTSDENFVKKTKFKLVKLLKDI